MCQGTTAQSDGLVQQQGPRQLELLAFCRAVGWTKGVDRGDGRACLVEAAAWEVSLMMFIGHSSARRPCRQHHSFLEQQKAPPPPPWYPPVVQPLVCAFI